jgi:hypothetical protein
VIFAVGNNGAEAFDYVRGKYAGLVDRALQLHGSGLSAAFGGNDFAGFNDLHSLLNTDCSGALAPQDCFKPGAGEGTLDGLMARIADDYDRLTRRILASCPDIKIFVHNYDYAIPTGKGVFGKGWLKPALADASVDPSLQADCIRLIVDRFTGVLQSVAAASGGQVVLVDSRGTLAGQDWANELHPKKRGFAKMAKSCWKPVLEAQGLAGDE